MPWTKWNEGERERENHWVCGNKCNGTKPISLGKQHFKCCWLGEIRPRSHPIFRFSIIAPISLLASCSFPVSSSHKYSKNVHTYKQIFFYNILRDRTCMNVWHLDFNCNFRNWNIDLALCGWALALRWDSYSQNCKHWKRASIWRIHLNTIFVYKICSSALWHFCFALYLSHFRFLMLIRFLFQLVSCLACAILAHSLSICVQRIISNSFIQIRIIHLFNLFLCERICMCVCVCSAFFVLFIIT